MRSQFGESHRRKLSRPSRPWRHDSCRQRPLRLLVDHRREANGSTTLHWERLASGAAIVLGLPFAIVICTGLIGLGVNQVPESLSWIMGSLTIVATISAGLIHLRKVNREWLLVATGAVLFWSFVFLQTSA